MKCAPKGRGCPAVARIYQAPKPCRLLPGALGRRGVARPPGQMDSYNFGPSGTWGGSRWKKYPLDRKAWTLRRLVPPPGTLLRAGRPDSRGEDKVRGGLRCQCRDPTLLHCPGGSRPWRCGFSPTKSDRGTPKSESPGTTWSCQRQARWQTAEAESVAWQPGPRGQMAGGTGGSVNEAAGGRWTARVRLKGTGSGRGGGAHTLPDVNMAREAGL